MSNTINKKRDNTNQLIWLVFLLNPFITFIYVMRKMYNKYFVSIVTAFCGFYGFTFQCSRESADCFQHRGDFVNWYSKRSMSWSDFTGFLYGSENDSIDILMPFLKYILSRVTDNPDVLYLILGLSFGFFLAKNLKMIYTEIGGVKSQFIYLFLLLFFFTVAPWEINSYRFWMGAQVFFFGLFPYLIKKNTENRKKLFFILFTPFIHFSFVYVLVVTSLYLILGNRTKLYIVMLFGSLFISNIEYSTIKSALPQTEISIVEGRKTAYLKDSEREGVANWYVSGRQIPIKWLTILLVFLIYYKEREVLESSRYYSLFSFMIFFLAINLIFLTTIPQFGRFYRNSLLFLYAFLFLFFSEKDLIHRKWLRNLMPFYLLAAMFWVIVELRVAFDSVSIDTIIFNPIIVMIGQINISLNEFIRQLF
jgi:hypothetical protein